jgi:hypothetical protein
MRSVVVVAVVAVAVASVAFMFRSGSATTRICLILKDFYYFKSCRVFPLWEKSDPDRWQV